jgi:hypothetical protein
MPPQRSLAGDGGDSGAVESEEQQRGAGATVTPAVREAVLVVVDVAQIVGDAEAAVAGVGEGDEWFGAATGGVDPYLAVELEAGDGERGGNAGKAMGEVRHLDTAG